ncbi:MAG: hypothetical protein IPI73_02250 [Betaproteobacteria bacterium]|nr:hypothetical protein [Betaproteobacteria bacterium]
MSAELRGLDGEYLEADLPLLVQRRGMAYWHDDHVRILDRRRLPHEEVELVCRSVEDVAVAIEEMAIRAHSRCRSPPATGWRWRSSIRRRQSATVGSPRSAWSRLGRPGWR